LELKGWVRNDPDGAVSVRIEGDRSAIEAFVDHMKTGPPSASVANVKTDWEPFTGEYDKFDVTY
jgi:acylphosphatase